MEEIIEKKEYIERSLSKHLLNFNKRVKFNRKRSIIQHISITILGAAIAILSGLKIECLGEDTCIEDYTRFIVLVLGSIVTILGAYKTFFNNTNLWIRYTMTANELKKLESEFKYYLAGKNDNQIKIDDLDSFKNRLQEILDNTNENWKSFRSSAL